MLRIHSVVEYEPYYAFLKPTQIQKKRGKLYLKILTMFISGWKDSLWFLYVHILMCSAKN